MLNTLRNPTFRHLFAAQLVALIGTGLATVALGLLAWKLAGDNAGAVLGTANPLPTLFAFDPVAPATEPYTSYLPALAGVRDLVIGSVRATLVPAGPLGATGTLTAPNVAAIWGNMAGDDAPTLSTSLTITPLNGTVQSFSPSLNSAAVATPVQLIAPASFVINSTKDGLKASTVASAGGLLAGNILISAPSGNNVSASMAQSYRATIGLTDPTDRWLASDLKTGPLETTDYEGSTFMAPWFAGSGAQSKTILRIANRGEMVTGKIVLSLASVVKMPGETVRLTTCSPFSSIPKDGEALISTALVTECFGNFVRGDLRISIQALTSALSVKMRILNTNGVVGEQSLGNITLGAQTPR